MYILLSSLTSSHRQHPMRSHAAIGKQTQTVEREHRHTVIIHTHTDTAPRQPLLDVCFGQHVCRCQPCNSTPQKQSFPGCNQLTPETACPEAGGASPCQASGNPAASTHVWLQNACIVCACIVATGCLLTLVLLGRRSERGRRGVGVCSVSAARHRVAPRPQHLHGSHPHSRPLSCWPSPHSQHAPAAGHARAANRSHCKASTCQLSCRTRA